MSAVFLGMKSSTTACQFNPRNIVNSSNQGLSFLLPPSFLLFVLFFELSLALPPNVMNNSGKGLSNSMTNEGGDTKTERDCEGNNQRTQLCSKQDYQPLSLLDGTERLLSKYEVILVVAALPYSIVG